MLEWILVCRVRGLRLPDARAEADLGPCEF